MIDEIITGISRQLDEVFNSEGDDYSIYSEKIEQGLKCPCFIIQVVDVSKTPFLCERAKRTYNFDIVYISETGTYGDMLNVAENLTTALHWITLLNGDKLMGFDMRYEIVDDVLHFFVTYPVTVNIQNTLPTMENYELNQNIEK